MTQYQAPKLSLTFFVCLLLLLGSKAVKAQSVDSNKTIQVIILKNFPPQFITTPEGPSGLAVEVIREVARRASLKIEFVPVNSWKEAFVPLENGSADVLANLGISEARKKVFEFTDSYEVFDIKTFIRKESQNINNINDLKGRLLGVISTNVLTKDLVASGDYQIKQYPSYKLALIGLLSGEVDAVPAPTEPFLLIARGAHLDDRIQFIGPSLLEVKRAIALPKGRLILRDKLNRALLEFKQTNAYKKLLTKWYGSAMPYWTITKVIVVMGTIFTAFIFLMFIWRYYAIVELNRRIRESEDEQRRSNVLFNQAEAMGNMGHWNWDLAKDKLISCSEQFARIYGMTVPEALDYFISTDAELDLVHPDDKELFRQAEYDTNGQFKEFGAEFRIITSSGDTHHLYVCSEFILDKDGVPSHSFGTVLDITDRKKSEEKLRYMASHDALTGLINRSEFEQRTNRLLSTIQNGKAEHAMCFLDLDQFKIINDTCGHVAGDELLRQLGRLLRDVIGDSGTLGRLGGDEFGLLIENSTIDESQRIAELILITVREFQFVWDGQVFRVGLSIGLVAISDGIQEMTELLQQADAACYMAKELGRDRIHIYHPDDSNMALRKGEMQWIAQINQALDEERFCLYAQPIKGISGNDEMHYEVLLRLLSEKGEIVPPGAFLPAAERYGLIEKIDIWVVKNTFELIAANTTFFGNIHFISINLSGKSLTNPKFLEYILSELNRTKIESTQICFEVTETVAIANLDAASTFISILKEVGFSFALDDFGSGLSSFGYLKTLPVDYLKIDGMFVKDIINDPIDKAMVESINNIGHVMGMKTIAEFVENDEIKTMLDDIGVDYVQGYGIGKPEPFSDVISQSDNAANLEGN